MERKERMFKKLNLKLEKEYNEFIKDFEELGSKELIKRCYEITTKENLSLMFHDVEMFDEKEIKFLLGTENTLSLLYDGWLDSDYNETELMLDSAKDYVRKFLKTEREMER